MSKFGFARVRGGSRFIWRRMSEWAVDLCMLGGIVARAARSLGLSGTLSVTHVDVALPDTARLPAALTLAFVSDFHAGPTTDPAVLAALFAELRRIDADVLLLGGDFVSCRAAYAARLATELAACRPRFGAYAVLGNHDLYAGDEEIVATLRQAGVRTLVNANVELAAPFADVSICGIDDPWIGKPDLDAAFAHAGPVRIWLTHSPDGLSLLRGQRFDVAFAGHTHGGQIALPGGKPIYVPNGPLARRYAYGQFPIPGNGRLIVSRGVGCSTLPVRLNADPEIVVCRLH